ncbi:hypothetical protein [Bradyrhizobium sp. 192]|uniref:hypothetical protein n=1 Tax=Bradyrhizobium sp. 192 TaxID=2782660 RepID=UPI001FFFBFD9|nr:hypothetical protein [Bradyrhizobium sp. 192]UPJ58432.1 hypothetical protein IVB24_00870 [Bradyrhizobium sp. 192]
MIDTVVVAPTPGGTSSSTLTGLSWPSIVAGAVVAFALTLVLLAFGTGLGLTMVSPWSGSGVSATTFKITTGLYLIVIAMLSSSVGGYIAGRLRSSWTDVERDEVYFRDTAHGFIAWALATILGATALAIPATSLLGGSAVGASQGAVNAAQISGPMDGYVDTLLRPDPAGAGGATGATSAAMTSAADSRSEMVRLFTRSFRDGSDLKGSDREYAAKVVASRTGMSQADADKRVNDVVTQVKADMDAARKATASLAFWLTAAMLLGAFCASLAATEGGGLRDGTWHLRRR